MATRVLTKKEADSLGLIPKKEAVGAAPRRVNPHVQEIIDQVKSTKPGQYVLYEPSDGKSFQSQVLRVRQAFNILGKPWPHTKPMEDGKFTAMKILSKRESFDRYPQQPLASNRADAAEESPRRSQPKPKAKSKSKAAAKRKQR